MLLELYSMYSKVQLVIKYIQYYIKASNSRGHGIHSPFVYDFVRNVLNDSNKYENYKNIESKRRQLLKNKSHIAIDDFGAGSAISGGKQRRICDIAKHAAKPAKYGQSLFRIVNYYHPESIIEVGTSLGLATCYLASGNNKALVHTLEGASSLATLAKKNFDELNISNIIITEGNFDDVLPDVLSNLSTFDLAFIDGNHRKAPTLKYFNELLSKINTSSILIFDDIHWSKEMEEAWEIMKDHSSVRTSMDLFYTGLIFFRDEFKAKQHYTIKF